jgi:hypothetical protein
MAMLLTNSASSSTERVCHPSFYHLGVFFFIDHGPPCNFFLAGVAMDPSQGNTSSLVMTNHLYRSLDCSIPPFEQS